jgi:hypothetical protein
LPKRKIKKEKFKDEASFGDFQFPEVKKNLPTWMITSFAKSSYG